MDEFSSSNFENASLNRIIKNAGISKGTFYYHFKNKESLYLFLLKTGFDAKWQFINEHTKDYDADFSQMDIFDKFLYQAKTGALFASVYPRYHKLSKMFTKEKGTQIYDKAIALLGDDSNNILYTMISESIKNDELDTSYDEMFIKKVMSHLFGIFDDIFEDRQEANLDATLKNLENYVKFIKYGLKSKK